MTDHAKMRQALMDGAIAAVATYGLEGTTTRRIVAFGNINEGYIYRYYEDRDDLLKKAFLKIDQKFEDIIESNITLLKDESIDKKERFSKLYYAMVNYILDNKNEALFYIRYYESTFLAGEIWEEHKKIYNRLVSDVKPMLKDDKFAFYASHHIFRSIVQIATSMLKVPIGDAPKGIDPMFEILYSVFDTYYK